MKPAMPVTKIGGAAGVDMFLMMKEFDYEGKHFFVFYFKRGKKQIFVTKNQKKEQISFFIIIIQGKERAQKLISTKNKIFFFFFLSKG